MISCLTREAMTIEEDDAQLLLRCRAGDREAFEHLYKRYERPVYRHAFYLLGHREDADDVMQETFFRVHCSLNSFRSECSIKTWLLRICSNLCNDALRKRRSHPQISMDLELLEASSKPLFSSNDPARMVERSDSLRSMFLVLQGMPLPDRNAIVLHLMEGLDYTQIAEVFGCSRGSAKMRVLRAVRRFKERVASFMGEE